MSVHEILEKRWSCRNFDEKEIPRDVLDKILRTAVKSPSGGGFQAYSIIKVTDSDKKKRLCELSRNQKFIEKAPVSLIFCMDMNRIERVNALEPCPCEFSDEFMNLWMGIIDATIVAQTLCLAAEEEGLKSIYIGNMIYNMKRTSELLKLPKHVIPVIMVTLGYPKSSGKISPKYDINVLVHENEYKSMNDDDLLKVYHEKNKDWSMKATSKFVDRIYSTAEKQKNIEYAEMCKNDIIDRGTITTYQYWFGCYYTKDESLMSYDDYVVFMKDKGFNWMGV